MKSLLLKKGFASLAAIAMCAMCCAQEPQAQAKRADPQELADRIQKEVAQLRGLPFKRTVKAESQGLAAFGQYLDDALQKEVSPQLAQHYGKLVRKLGLYNGPEIENGPAMMKTVMTSQAGAYYDPDSETFYVLMPDMPELILGTLYAHELYHGLQDQYFDLNRYVLTPARLRQLNTDELLARQSVVEGEATYLMTLWMFQRMTGNVPSRETLSMAVQLQANMDMEVMRTALKQPQVAQMMGEEMHTAIAAIDKIPPFMFDTLIGAYLKGLGFVFAVEERGWSEVEKLYGDRPPVSTEQILHPEKWFANELPTAIAWQSFTGKELRGWELIDSDVLGEFRLRSVFKEQGLAKEASALAADWDGDRYAVFKRKDSPAMLLLFSTAWDSEAAAKRFAEGYRKALATKYAGTTEATRLVQKGKDVLIVEGGDESNLDALIRFVGTAKHTKTTSREPASK